MLRGAPGARLLQGHGEDGASVGRATIADVPAVLGDDPGGDGEAEAVPLPLRREERLEDMGAEIRRDPGAGVGDLDDDVPVARARPDGEAAALAHRLAGVQADVQE